jgi:uncharacterized membrane protein
MNPDADKKRRLRRSGWGVPFVYAAVTFTVGMILPRVEHHYLPNLVSTMSAAAAMGVCSAIASGMIAMTGIVFSMAFVMVQFSATAYSPRLVLCGWRAIRWWPTRWAFSAPRFSTR